MAGKHERMPSDGWSLASFFSGTSWHCTLRKQKQEEGYADTLERKSSDRSFFSCETCDLYFYRDNSLDYFIQSEYIYKTREALVYHFLFSSSNVTSFLLFCSSIFFLFLTHTRYLSRCLSVTHSFAIFLRFTYLHLLPFLSLFLLFLARVSSTRRNRKHVGGNCMRDTLLLPWIDREYRHSDEFTIRDKIRRHN